MKVLKFTYQYLVLEKKKRSFTEVGLQFEKTEAPLKWGYKDNFVEFTFPFLFHSFLSNQSKGYSFLGAFCIYGSEIIGSGSSR